MLPTAWAVSVRAAGAQACQAVDPQAQHTEAGSCAARRTGCNLPLLLEGRPLSGREIFQGEPKPSARCAAQTKRNEGSAKQDGWNTASRGIAHRCRATE